MVFIVNDYRMTVATYQLDNVGKAVYKVQHLYNGSHKRYLKLMLNTLHYDNVLLVKFQHGKSKRMIMEMLKGYPKLNCTVKTKYNVLILSENDSPHAVDIIRSILKNRDWEKL